MLDVYVNVKKDSTDMATYTIRDLADEFGVTTRTIRDFQCQLFLATHKRYLKPMVEGARMRRSQKTERFQGIR